MAKPVFQGDDATTPESWSVAANWDTGSVPVNGDEVYLYSNTQDITAGLAQSAVTVDELHIYDSFTGDIGTVTALVGTELAIGATLCTIGEPFGTGTAVGSDRVLINFGSVATTCNIYKSNLTPADSNRESIRIRGTSATNVVNVLGSALVGIGTNDPDDTATVTLNAYAGTVNCGIGVTIKNANVGSSAGAATVKIWNGLDTGGVLRLTQGTVYTYGTGTIPTVTQNGGTFYDGSTGTTTAHTVQSGATLRVVSGAKTITTLNLAGTLDLTEMTGALTVTTFNVTGSNYQIIDPNGRLSSQALVFGSSIQDPFGGFRRTIDVN
jgi:hypothetical protein